MATETVLNWITRDMKLSKQVTSFETDFSNGYMFGEILQRYELVEDLNGFSKKPGKDAKVKNFQQVEAVLRDLKVKFDGKLIHQIMNEERGAALRLLYQMKLAIEKADIGGVDAGKMTMTGLKPDLVNRKLEETLGLRTSLPVTSKLTTVNGAKKLAPIERHMLPYEYKKQLLEEKAVQRQKQEEDLIIKLRSDAREEELRKMEENKEFMTQWMKEGHQNWKKNQTKRAEAIARVKYFEDREVKIYKDKLSKELDDATKELIGGVKEFEGNLQKLGIEKNTNIEEAIKRMEEKKGVPPGQIQNFSYAATMNKIKEKKGQLDFAVKERDRRRRKMMVDQAKTQNELERKKNEELLIEKLLGQQASEQKMAYLERRGRECKTIIEEQRRVKAVKFEEKKRSKIEELERIRNETAAQEIERHRKELAERKREHQALRRDEKYKKRSVNVEICSEVMDLILDIANEAWDESQKTKNGKLNKPMWREWMDYFKQNKVVSRARRGLLDGQQESAFVIPSADPSILDESFDVLENPNKTLEDVLEAMKYDPAYEDLLQYLSISGIFNITQGDFPEWFDLKKLLSTSPGVDTSILDSLIPRQNPGLGRYLHQLIKDQQTATASIAVAAQNTTNGSIQIVDEEKKEAPVVTQEVGIPHHLSLKLCLLGRSCAGKRTIAKQIAETYPQGKVKVFRMEELVKEVLDYINPKPQADAAAAAADKNKKAPPPKGGKAEDVGPVDQFAGMDTKEYKEIGHQIKKFIGEDQSASADVISLITDDTLLVNLFIQKLKLTFTAEKSEQAKVEEIKQNMAKEKELLEQLAELEAANAGQDPKAAAAAKGAKAPPAKGGKGAGGPSGEEQLRAELDQVTKVQPEGWILIDFPRNLKQAKTFERLMNNGFTPMTDRPKEAEQRLFEQWSKLVTPASTISQGDEEATYDGLPFIYKSAADAYLFVEVGSDEITRRLSHRKIDPTTGTIYHMEDNPPPEGDPKLKDRLQDYHGDAEQDSSRLAKLHALYDSAAPSLKTFTGSFGLRDDTLDHGVVSSLMHVEAAPKMKREEVSELVMKQIANVIGFKQQQYEQKKLKVRDMIEKEAQMSAQENTAMVGTPAAAEHHQEHAEGGDVPGTLSQEPSLQDLKNSVHNTQYSKHSGIGGATNGFGGGHNLGTRSLTSIGRSQKQMALNDEAKRALWRNFESDYYRECLQVFRAVKKQRVHVFEGLTQMQAQFIDRYLAHADGNVTTIIQDFVDSYNKFSEEFPNLRQDHQTQIELKKRVAKLSNDVWALVEHKKDQALTQHNKLNSDGWVVNEMKKLMKSACHIIQVELQRYFTALQIVTGYTHVLDIDLEKTLDNYSDDGAKTIDDHEQSPLFDKIYAYALRIIQGRYDHLSAIPDEPTKHILKTELESVVYRLNLMRTWILLKVKEFNQFWRQLYEVLDDAILIAIKLENDATQAVVKSIGEHIEEVAITGKYRPMDHQDFRVPYVDVEQAIEKIDFSNADVPLYMQNITVPEDPVLDMRLSTSHLSAFYQDFRYHSYDQYLDGQTFIHLIVVAFQAKRVPFRWRYYDYTVFNEMIQKVAVVPPMSEHSEYANSSVQQLREFVDWKKLLTMFALLMSPLPDSEHLAEYKEDLMEHGNTQLSLAQFVQVPAWFDNFESQTENPLPVPTNISDEEEEAERNRDPQRLIDIKTLLFKVHQSNTRVLKVEEYIRSIEEMVGMAQGCSNFHAYLFDE